MNLLEWGNSEARFTTNNERHHLDLDPFPNSAVEPKDIHLYRICRGCSPSPSGCLLKPLKPSLSTADFVVDLVFFDYICTPVFQS